MSELSSTKNYVPALDGLRGIAIVLVVWFHTRIPPFDQGGFIGVDIFLVLSGFLITRGLLREFDSTGAISFKRFYMRRVLRLGPALLMTLIMFNFYSVLFLDVTAFAENLRSTMFTLFNVANITKAMNLDVMSALGHTWSLSLEEQFYIVYPFCFLFILRFAKTKTAVSAVLSVLALMSWLQGIYLIGNGADWQRVHFAPDTRFYQLLIGCLVAVLTNLSNQKFESRQNHISYLLEPIAWGATVVLLGLAVNTRADASSTYYSAGITIALLTAAIILHTLSPQLSFYNRCLEMRWLIYLGRISYGWYLYHQLIFVLFLHSENMRLFIGVPLSLAVPRQR